ncbi:MAG: hypothetical protein IKN81_05210 [Oscillospiraceae bacterium]|nr:hypothetical protein [Oscillospiraceae bacterium]
MKSLKKLLSLLLALVMCLSLCAVPAFAENDDSIIDVITTSGDPPTGEEGNPQTGEDIPFEIEY